MKDTDDGHIYKFRFIAHDRSGVGNSIGEELLLRVGPIVDPIFEAVGIVVTRVTGSFGRSIEKAEGVGVSKEEDVDNSGLL